ncbi:MAG: hypothetical protein ACJATI_001359 [Halioglobus sp.]
MIIGSTTQSRDWPSTENEIAKKNRILRVDVIDLKKAVIRYRL